jgi:uncharacterized MnhB-related membrane protein
VIIRIRTLFPYSCDVHNVINFILPLSALLLIIFIFNFTAFYLRAVDSNCITVLYSQGSK